MDITRAEAVRRIASQLDSKWQEDFVQYAENAEASEEFLLYASSSPECQKACDEVIAMDNETFKNVRANLEAERST